MSSASAKSTARKSRNDSPAPKATAKTAAKPGDAAAKAKATPGPGDKKEEQTICGLHPEAWKALILGPLAVVAVITVMVFMDLGAKIVASVQEHYHNFKGPVANVLLEHEGTIVAVALFTLMLPLVVVAVVTFFRAFSDLQYFNWWQKILFVALIGTALGLHFVAPVTWEKHANSVCSDQIGPSKDSSCMRGCLRDASCVAVTRGADESCLLCKSTSMANTTDDVDTYIMPEGLKHARNAVKKGVKRAEQRAKALKKRTEDAVKKAEENSAALKKEADEVLARTNKESEDNAKKLVKAAESALQAAKDKIETGGSEAVEKASQKLKEAKEHGQKLIADAKGAADRAKAQADQLVTNAKATAAQAKERADKMIASSKENLRKFKDAAKDATFGYVTTENLREWWEHISNPLEEMMATRTDEIIAAAAILCMAPLAAALAMFTLRAVWGLRLQIVPDEQDVKK